MSETRDFGIAVADAKRLNDYYRELTEAFAERPAVSGDTAHWWRATASTDDSDDGRAYVHRHNSANVAEALLKTAVANRSLVRLANRDELVDLNAIATLGHRAIAAGAYLTENHPKSFLEGRPLWIKDSDWCHFFALTMSERYGEATAVRTDPLGLWLALELRRARAAFDKGRREQDAEYEARGLRRAGVRVKVTLKSASEICVALADRTIAMATEFRSDKTARIAARDAVQAFTKELTDSAVPLAFYVSGESSLGGSVVKAASERGAKLLADIAGAFLLSEMTLAAAPTGSDQRVSELIQLWGEEAISNFERERDSVTEEFGLNGRLQSAYHIRRLFEAAENAVGQLLSRARALPIPPSNYANLDRHALRLFEQFVRDIKSQATGLTGRTPRPENNGIVDHLSGPSWARIAGEVKRWQLEDGLRGSTLDQTAPSGHLMPAAPPPRRGRKKGSGSMIVADRPFWAEMHGLISEGKAHSPNGAAAMVAKRASGSGTMESIISRLAKGYRASEFNSDA